MVMGLIGGRGAIVQVLLSFSKFCFQIITKNMLNINSSQINKKWKFDPFLVSWPP